MLHHVAQLQLLLNFSPDLSLIIFFLAALLRVSENLQLSARSSLCHRIGVRQQGELLPAKLAAAGGSACMAANPALSPTVQAGVTTQLPALYAQEVVALQRDGIEFAISGLRHQGGK